MAEEANAPAERKVAIQKIYVKDFSFESPQTPQVFTQGKWEPKTNLNLRSTHSAHAGDHHEVVLTVTAETKQDDKTVFLVELQQAGLFYITGYSGEEFAAVVGSFCPSVLFPYAREAIASLVSKGGFPELLLQPINFDALYAQSRAQAAAQAGAPTPPPAAGPAEPAGSNGGGGH